MTLASILFPDEPPEMNAAGPAEPDFFVDLNLDQVVADFTDGRAEYRLEAFYRAPLPDVRTIRYRQRVFQDVERDDLRDRLGLFADEMVRMRRCLAQAA